MPNEAISFDTSELEELSVRLTRLPAAAVAPMVAVVTKGAVNVKKDARSRVSTHPTWKRLAETINFDQIGLTAVIGYEDRGQGELAGIAEFGSARHAPHPALLPALTEEAPKFEKASAEAVAKAIRDAL